MAASSEPQPLTQPLNVGNVVSAGLRLYREHFKQYFGIAVIATLWSLLPIVALIPLAIVAAIAISANSEAWGIVLLLISAWIVLALYCYARFFARSASITRLAFGELTQQPESSTMAGRFTRSRMWSFVLLNVLVGLIFLAVLVGSYFVAAIPVVVAFLASGGATLFRSSSPEEAAQIFSNNPSAVIAPFLLTLAIVLVLVLFLLWFGSRFAIVDVPLAIEAETGATGSIGRSWSLTSRNAWRIVLIFVIAALIMLPLYFIYWIISAIFNGILIYILASDSSSPLASSYTALATLIRLPLSLVLNIFVLPLWQAIKAVVYYDLRSRREGLGLQLRDRSL